MQNRAVNTPPSLTYLLRGPFGFLRPEADELRALVPDHQESLPLPQRIYLEDEASTPLWGFPLLVTRSFQELRTALGTYLEQEEKAQTQLALRRSSDRKAHGAAWDAYRTLLSQALENVTLSSYGRHYPSIFWLYHSLDIARFLKETPKRILRVDLELGRSQGDALKYQIFDRFQDRLLATTYDMVNRLALDTEELEEELFPSLLRRMLDNVLIFTEDYISPGLTELSSYFNGSLHIDGKDLRKRLEELTQWHMLRYKQDPVLTNFAVHVLKRDPEENPVQLLTTSGYCTFLATLPGYDTERLLGPAQLRVWESLLVKLKEFELFHALRRFTVPMKRKDDRLYCRPSLSRTWMGKTELYLSPATRPLDFMAAWVVDPLVDRFGLVYDITEFSAVLSMLGMSGHEMQEESFRLMFRFQRRLNQLAKSYRMKLEKYLGDGAFYSGRHPRDLLIGAVHLQRCYAHALEEGFPFDRGMRIALNYGSYRLIPLRSNSPREERYEFFGHGLVELSRLTTGKATKEIDEVKTMLISQGYEQSEVFRFFAPMTKTDVDLVDRQQESRPFYAYINQNGHLINEGIVATEKFITGLQLDQDLNKVYRLRHHGASYLVLPLQDSAGNEFLFGLRKLGLARLKGLDQLPVYEIVDGEELDRTQLSEIPRTILQTGLLAALESELTRERHDRSGAKRLPPPPA